MTGKSGAVTWMGLLLAVIGFGIASPALAQAVVTQPLNWEGQAGAIVTPFAQTADSSENGGRLSVGFHLLNAGEVLGTRFQISFTAAFMKRVEVGYTRSAVAAKEEPLSSLFDRGFNTIHAKVNLLSENWNGTQAPAVSAGFLARWQKSNIEEEWPATKNGDLFVVATKTLAPESEVPLLVSGGLRVTNASLYGVSGNAPDWTAGVFFTGGVVLAERALAGVEYSQQPSEIEDFPGTDVPDTVSFFVRLLPVPKIKLGIDLAIVRLAKEIGPGLEVKADTCFMLGGSVRF